MLASPLVALVTLFGAPPASALPPSPAQAGDDWHASEAASFGTPVQLTFRAQFLKAGEAYFDPAGRWIIFQAIAAPPPGEKAAEFYAMYVARLVRDDAGQPTGLADLECVSLPDSANTCGWFDPAMPGRIIYGSTLAAPTQANRPGFQVGTNRYVWSFPDNMDVVGRDVPRIWVDLTKLKQDEMNRRTGANVVIDPPRLSPKPVARFTKPGYTAECSFDPTGRFLLYAQVNPDQPGKPDADIWVLDTKSGTHTPLVVAPGYDGGPFFSPDGQRICYRSDRAGNDLLQLYVADLAFRTDPDGTSVPVGITTEYQLTANEHVNWAPYWHPSGSFLIYASSAVSHRNYELFRIPADAYTLRARAALATDAQRASVRSGSADAGPLRDVPSVVIAGAPTRVTFAPGADVLPAFSPDGAWLLWTAQRSTPAPGEDKPSSQLFIAPWLAPAPGPQVPASEHTPDQAPVPAERASGTPAAAPPPPPAQTPSEIPSPSAPAKSPS